MTDKEIEKALACCSDGTCKKCPYFLAHDANCIVELEKDALDYINRLKAEKEQIRKETALVELPAELTINGVVYARKGKPQ